MLVWLGRRTVQNMVIRIVTRRIGSDQYTLLFGRPVQTGQVLFELKFTTAQSAPLPSRLPSMGFKVTVPVFQVIIFHYENIPFLICIQMVGGGGVELSDFVFRDFFWHWHFQILCVRSMWAWGIKSH